jgi:trk system potassium uptake protein TrkA
MLQPQPSGRRRNLREAPPDVRLHPMYILIAGRTDVSFHIAELLMTEHQVVLIGPEPHSIPRLDRLDVEIIPGEATRTEILNRAHIDKCNVFIAANNNDEHNLVACLAARRLGAKRVLCLLSQPAFIDENESENSIANSLGLDAVIRPSSQLARELTRIVTVPGALDVQNFAQGRIRLLSHEIELGAPLLLGPLSQTNLPTECVLVLCRRGPQVFIPMGGTVFQAGDRVTAIGSARGIHALLYDYLRATDHTTDSRRAMIIGGGVVGLKVALGLERAGWEIKLIESDYERCQTIAHRLKGLVLHGDGSDMELLQEEQIEDYPVLLSVTATDEKNLLISLIAKQLGVKRIITRADHLNNERMFERVGIDVVRSARGAAIRKVVREAIDGESEIRGELEHGDMHVIEIELPATTSERTVSDYHAAVFCILGAIIRDGRVIFPKKDSTLRAGDHLFIFTSLKDEKAAHELFMHGPSEVAMPKPSALEE